MIDGIHVYCGPRGHGKSNFAMAMAGEYASSGCSIVSNIKPVWPEFVRTVENEWGVTPEEGQWTVIDRVDDIMASLVKGRPGRPTLLIIDECNIWYPQLGWDKQASKKFLDWIVQSRKDRVDVILIIQAPDNLSCEFRRQVVCAWTHYRISKLPFFGWIFVLLHIDLVLRNCHMMQYGKIAVSSSIRKQWRIDGSRWWKTYDQWQMFRDFELRAGADWKPRVVHGKAKLRFYWRAFRLPAAAALLITAAGCMRHEKRQAKALLLQLEKDRSVLQSEIAAARAARAALPAAGVSSGMQSPLSGRPDPRRPGSKRVSSSEQSDEPMLGVFGRVVDIEGRAQVGAGWVVVQHGRTVGIGDPLDDGRILLGASEHFGQTDQGTVVWRCAGRVSVGGVKSSGKEIES